MPQVKLPPEAGDRRPSRDPLWSCFEGEGRQQGHGGDGCGYVSRSFLQAAVWKYSHRSSEVRFHAVSEARIAWPACSLPDKRTQ
ncbi:uncharacterized protein WM294_012840 isoform 4-T5 [Sarcoramphus papa]